MKTITQTIRLFVAKNRFFILAVICIIAYIGIISWISVTRYLSLHSHYYDLGIMSQAVYNTAHGRFLEITNPHIFSNTSRLAIHVDPIIAILAPLYLINPTPTMLLISQTMIIALGGLAVYRIAYSVTRSKGTGALFTFLFLSYYPLQYANLFDFHAVNFATTGLLFAFYFLALTPFRHSWKNTLAGCVALVVSILAKENVSLVIMFMGFYLFYLNKNRKLAVVLSLISLVYFFIAVFYIIPHFSGGQSFAVKYYDFHHPFYLLRRLLSLSSVRYIGDLLAPVSFLSLLSPLQLMIATPEFLINLFSTNDNMRSLAFQYTALLTPFIYISSIYGFVRLREWVHKRFHRNAIVVIALFMFILNLLITFSYGLPSQTLFHPNRNQAAFIRKWQKQLDNDSIIVSTTGSLAPFFTQREYFIDFLFDPAIDETNSILMTSLNKYDAAQYILIYNKDFFNITAQHYYRQLQQDKNFIKIDADQDIEVYRRIDTSLTSKSDTQIMEIILHD